MATLRYGIRFGALALAGTLMLSACGHGLPNQGVGQVSVARGQAVLMVKPQVIAGGYKAQALAENYKKSDINHLVIKVFELQGEVEIPVVDEAGNQVQVDLLNSELDVPVKFSNLFRDTTYRIRCYAYKAPGDAPANLISTLDASSYTDVSITNDNAPTVAQLRVRLVDVVFNGEFTSGVDVTEGGFVAGGAVTVTKQTPNPTPNPTPTPSPTPDSQPARTVSFLDETSAMNAGSLIIESISQDAVPGVYELKIYVDEWQMGGSLQWGGASQNLDFTTPGQQIVLEGTGGAGTITISAFGGMAPGYRSAFLVIQ